MGEETLTQVALNWQGWFVICLLVVILACLIKEVLPSEITPLIGGSVPVVLGIVSPKVFLYSFANETIITIAALFIVVQSFEETRLLTLFSQKISPEVKNRIAQLFIILPPLSFFSAFLNNTPIVIMMTPTFRQWSLKKQMSPSKFLIPLSFSTIAGGACTLIGTSTNLVVNGLMFSETGVSLSFFEIGKVGIFFAALILIYLIFFSRYLLSDRTDPDQLIAEKIKKMTAEFLLEEGSPFINETMETLSEKYLKGDFSVIEIEREKKRIQMPGAHEKVLLGDHLTFVGDVQQMPHLHSIKGLTPTDPHFKFSSREPYYSEFAIPAGSTLAGRTLSRCEFRKNYRGSVFAIFREGQNVKGKLAQITLKAGDVLMVFSSTPWEEGKIPSSRDLLLVKATRAIPVFSFYRAMFSLIVTILMILSSTFFLPMMVSALAAAIIIIVSRTVATRDVVKSINWNLLLLIAGGLALSSALDQSGVGRFLASKLFPFIGESPRVLIEGIFLITAIVTELVTNTAAALLIFPIALQMMKLFGTHSTDSIKAVGITIAIAASCSFLAPIGYQTNTIVYEPGGYKFSDYFKIGLPLILMIWCLCVGLIPYFWPVR